MWAAYGTVTLYRVLVSCWYAAIKKKRINNIKCITLVFCMINIWSFTDFQGEDTRGCGDTIGPPDDEQGTAQNLLRIMIWHIYCYRIKELCIKLVCMYVCIYRVQNVFLHCPTPRLHCFLSSHWPSFRFLSFMAFFIPSIQFFYAVRHLDSTASYLPTGLHLCFFRSWPSLFLPSSFSTLSDT